MAKHYFAHHDDRAHRQKQSRTLVCVPHTKEAISMIAISMKTFYSDYTFISKVYIVVAIISHPMDLVGSSSNDYRDSDLL